MPRHYARDLSTTAAPASRFAAWVNRQQLDVIDHWKEEPCTAGDPDAQRRRLAEKAKHFGRKVLNDVASIVTRKLITMSASPNLRATMAS